MPIKYCFFRSFFFFILDQLKCVRIISLIYPLTHKSICGKYFAFEFHVLQSNLTPKCSSNIICSFGTLRHQFILSRNNKLSFHFIKFLLINFFQYELCLPIQILSRERFSIECRENKANVITTAQSAGKRGDQVVICI